MLLICEGLFFFAGLYSLITARFRLYGKRTVQGDRARLIGLVLMLPGPLAFTLDIFIAGSVELTEETLFNLTLLELLIVVGAFVLAIILFVSAPEDARAAPSRPEPSRLPNILTVPEAAQYLRVSEQQVVELIETSRLAAVKVGADYRIAKRALDDFMQQ
jgi:excisionase family DNA binding protein